MMCIKITPRNYSNNPFLKSNQTFKIGLISWAPDSRTVMLISLRINLTVDREVLLRRKLEHYTFEKMYFSRLASKFSFPVGLKQL